MPVTVVIAPDSLKGTATAPDAASALARGWQRARPQDIIRLFPMADGGEGTLDAFGVARRGAERIPVTVTGPDDRSIDTAWLRYRDDQGLLTGLVELASTSGITLLEQLCPGTAHTRGFGQAIAAALDSGVDRLVLAIGSSCSTDGGAGMLTELGARFLDDNGAPIGFGNTSLATLATADLRGLAAPPAGGITVLTDVTNPLLGPNGAVAVFGPQKGIDATTAPSADMALQRFSRVVSEVTDADPDRPGAGAAGGTGFGLQVWGADIVPGAPAVAREIGLPAVVATADLLITGEGCYDDQSEQGKVASHIRALARADECRIALVAGMVSSDASTFDAVVSLSELAGSPDRAMTEPLVHLERAGEMLAEPYSREALVK